MTEEIDTDSLVAIVRAMSSSSLPEEQVLDALAICNGDPTAAAQHLTKKRKRAGLDGWLKPGTVTTSQKRKAELPVPPIASTLRHSSRPPSSKSSASPKPAVDLMSVLQQAPEMHKSVLKLPPLLLSSPAMVAKHIPCVTLHPSVLPQELACRLFYTMIDHARDHNWSRNKWWLFDRVVESPHRTNFFARRTNGLDDNHQWQEAAQYWQVSDPVQSLHYLNSSEMEEACCVIERVVNDELRKRPRFPLEWAGSSKDDPGWRANVAASNCYDGGKEGVHPFSLSAYTFADIQKHLLVLAGTSRRFRLREIIPNAEAESRHARTFNIPVTHNSLTIMHASCQEKFKHCVPQENAIDAFRPPLPRFPGGPVEPSNIRINITFRFYRPDFRPDSIPRCKCDIPMILRPDMKNHVDGITDKYWWACSGGAQNDGKTCSLWQLFDMSKEGRGPVVADAQGP
ncbi:GRF zinc finger family protein [Mycena indigotica]|uniref:GRF zinc finger family protein n=1 Tax=Mycena indigotica TaxID=2126181 RepID=A0A8H6SAE2_9AGAR|nr:GRF zinc finger family protein [Mycena indigotica]KAF7295327.1 GRF zinc finger family protein [Mycena indigotica]